MRIVQTEKNEKIEVLDELENKSAIIKANKQITYLKQRLQEVCEES